MSARCSLPMKTPITTASADKWETYDGAVLKTAAFDEDHDGRPDRRLTYTAGALTSIESQPDASGKFSRLVPITTK